MLTISELQDLYDQEQRIAITYPGTDKATFPNLVRFTRPAPGMNFVRYSRLDSGTLDAVIQEQVAYFQPLNQPFEWQVYVHDLPPELPERLVAQGFAPDDDPAALMLLDLDHAPPALLAPITADIRCLTQPEELEVVISITTQVWGSNFDWMRQRFGAHLALPNYLFIYVAYVDGLPASVGWVYLHPHSQFASLYGGSTLPAYRHQGLYSAVLAARVQLARQRGYRFLTVEAGPMSQPIVAKHGFQWLSTAYAYEWRGVPPAATAP